MEYHWKNLLATWGLVPASPVSEVNRNAISPRPSYIPKNGCIKSGVKQHCLFPFLQCCLTPDLMHPFLGMYDGRGDIAFLLTSDTGDAGTSPHVARRFFQWYSMTNVAIYIINNELRYHCSINYLAYHTYAQHFYPKKICNEKISFLWDGRSLFSVVENQRQFFCLKIGKKQNSRSNGLINNRVWWYYYLFTDFRQVTFLNLIVYARMKVSQIGQIIFLHSFSIRPTCFCKLYIF